MVCKDCDLRLVIHREWPGGLKKTDSRHRGLVPPPLSLYHLQPPTPALMIGLAPLPTPTPSPSVKPRILLRHWSRLRTRRRSSSVGPSASKTCNLAEGWCLTPNRPRPLMSIRWRYWPFVTHDWAARGARQGRRQFSIRLRAPTFFPSRVPSVQDERRPALSSELWKGNTKKENAPTTNSSLFNPFAIAWSLASATIESSLGACFFSEACNCKMASSAVRPAINRARSFSLRRDVLKLAVDDLCCCVPYHRGHHN